MQEFVPLGPVSTDTALIGFLASEHFRKDSLSAMKKTDSALAPVSRHDIFVFAKEKKDATIFVPSFLSGHSLQPGPGPVHAKKDHVPGWIHGTLLLILMLAAFLNWRYFSRLRTLFSAFLLNRFIVQLTREENVYFNRVTLLLSVMYLLITGLFSTLAIFHLGIKLPFEISPVLLFPAFCGGLFLLFLFKIIVVKTAGAIFAQERSANEYAFSIILYNQMASLFLIPILFCIVYFESVDPTYLAWIGSGMLVLFYLFRLLRVVTGGFASPSVSLSYLFLYLCTLEILPVAITLKVIMA